MHIKDDQIRKKSYRYWNLSSNLENVSDFYRNVTRFFISVPLQEVTSNIHANNIIDNLKEIKMIKSKTIVNKLCILLTVLQSMSTFRWMGVPSSMKSQATNELEPDSWSVFSPIFFSISRTEISALV